MTQHRAEEKNGFPHFMLKEIHEQPQSLARVIGDHMDAAGRIQLSDLGFPDDEIRAFSKITIAASGSGAPGLSPPVMRA